MGIQRLKKYGIRHKATKTGMIEQAILPPRLCEWTTDMNKIQLFDENEAYICAEFISKYAFNVEVFLYEKNVE